MRPVKYITFILGILMIVMGAYCLFNPDMTFMTSGYIIGVIMVADAVGGILLWFDRRKFRPVSVWALIGWILSLLFGIFIICSTAAQLFIDMTIVYLAAAWLAALGVIRMITALKIRSIHKELETKLLGRRWWLVLIGGILLIACGVLSFFYPSGLAIALGILIGLSIIITGANMIAVSL